MKKFFLTIIALVGSVACYAQLSDGMTATLQVGETTTVFYGNDAFKDAIAATPADAVAIITLSPGSFSNPGNVSKNIKVYGAGFQPDLEKNIGITSIQGDFNIVSTTDVTPVVRLEGVYIVGHLVMGGPQTISDTEIVKCCFGGYYNRAETNNTIIRQSYIREGVWGENCKAVLFLLANCYVGNNIRNFGASSSVQVVHCVLAKNYTSWYSGNNHGPYTYKGNLINQRDNASGYIASGAACYYNVGVEKMLSNNSTNITENNYDIALWTDCKTLFADGQDDMDYYDADSKPRTWVLADPTKYVDSDGTPCGVTGGAFPWNPIPATPRIYETSVDAKSEAGKLKVTVKAEARPIE